MGVLLLEEEMRVHSVDHNLHRTHIKDPIVQKLVEAGHMVKHEQLIHMYRVAGYGQLPRSDAKSDEIRDDLFFCLLDGGVAVDAAVVQSGRLVVADYV